MTLGGRSALEALTGELAAEGGIQSVLIKFTSTRVDSFRSASESVRLIRSNI